MLWLLAGSAVLRLVRRTSIRPMVTDVENTKLGLFMLANVWIFCIPAPYLSGL